MILALVMALSLVACSNGGTDKPDDNTETKKIKVGFITLHDENSTYDLNFINAAKEACQTLGLVENEDYFIKKNVPEGQECYNAAAELAEQGCNIIFADSFGHESFMIEAAKEFPNVQFCHSTGVRAHTEGLSNYHNAFASIYEGRYLAGIAAGMKLNQMIAEGKITADKAKMGYVGAFTYAEVISGYTSFFLGARSVCPTATMEVTFTGSWYDETAEKEGAEKLIQNGCVLISQHADSMGAPTACEKAGVPNVSYNGSTVSVGPNTYIISSRIDWAPYYVYAIQAAMDGKTIDADWTGTLATKSVVLSDLNTNVAADGTRTVLDQFTKRTAPVCADDEHSYVYDRTTGELECSVCGHTENAAQLQYNGWATDKDSGRKMFFSAGQPVTGYVKLSDQFYLFDETGLAYEGNYDLCGESCFFESGKYVSSSNADVLNAGKLGDDIAYVIYKDGRMVLDGTGRTYDFQSNGMRPYIHYIQQIRSIRIGSGIQYVGTYLFAFTNVTSVESAPDGALSYIGPAAFYQCYYLQSIEIPSSVRHIGNNTFAGCPVLSKVVIPSETTAMHYNTFRNSAKATLYVVEGSYAQNYAINYNIPYVLTSTPISGGIVTVNGVLYYYKGGHPYYAGLFQLDGNYYYARSSGQLVVDRVYWITKTNDLLPAANYQFDASGKMVGR